MVTVFKPLAMEDEVLEVATWQMRWARRVLYGGLLALWLALLLNMSFSIDFGIANATDIDEVARRVLLMGFVAGMVFLGMNWIVVRMISTVSNSVTRWAFGRDDRARVDDDLDVETEALAVQQPAMIVPVEEGGKQHNVR